MNRSFPLEVRRAAVRRYQGGGVTLRQVAAEFGCCCQTVHRWLGEPHFLEVPAEGFVSNAPLREAFKASGLPLTEVARRLGWLRERGQPDSTRVARTLGLRDEPVRHTYRAEIRYETAVALAAAIGVDPVDVGI